MRCNLLCTSLIPALERQRQVDLYESEAKLVYLVSSKPAKAIVWDSVGDDGGGGGDLLF